MKTKLDGKKFHIDIDDEEYGRVASNCTVIEGVGHGSYLVAVDTIRANIVVNRKELKKR
jgi:hypothetical protein